MADDVPPHVLVIDDEPNIRDLVRAALRFHGFTVSSAGDGATGLDCAREEKPDLILLDVLLPDISGFEVCRKLRGRGDDVPVIYLTARDTPTDTVTGLSLGGDDYVTKPFSVEALIARIRALLRRANRDAPAGEGGGVRGSVGLIHYADLEIDERKWKVRRDGRPIDLSPTEFRLLAYLAGNAGQVVTRAQILENVWGGEYTGQSQVLETYISYLRRKLDRYGPPLIRTQRGVGYALRAPDAR
ncbi:response regulator transcription factor [Nocardiopsis potens]|uniref:response regulator transcription factor n=1 Tax=Nocardiopsis potens TaxID=1246458 RepID=UPI000345FDF3|nr:response regulator transcription factor [Nocardiopsis potens]